VRDRWIEKNKIKQQQNNKQKNKQNNQLNKPTHLVLQDAEDHCIHLLVGKRILEM
jgi:hypothetical protein